MIESWRGMLVGYVKPGMDKLTVQLMSPYWRLIMIEFACPIFDETVVLMLLQR